MLNLSNNKLNILNFVREKEAISKTEIAKDTKLGWGTVIKFVDSLITENILEEIGYADSTGGRKANLIKLNKEAGFLVGVDLGASTTKIIITDFGCNILHKRETYSHPYEEKDKIFQELFKSIDETIVLSGVDRKKIKGIGLSISGNIDTEKGLIITAGNLGIREMPPIPIKEMLEEYFKIPSLAVGTRAAVTIGEKFFGLGKGINDLVCVNIGIGIGSGVISHGELVKSTFEKQVGYIGHILVEKTGPQCGCGGYGCLESFAGGRAIANQMKELLSKGENSLVKELVYGEFDKITAAIITEAAKKGDELSCKILKKAGQYIDIGISNMIQLYHPDKVILGGGLIQSNELLLKFIKEAISDAIPQERFDINKIVISKLENYAGPLGAIQLIWEEVLK
ncbi:MAG: ROK family protein [Candidatus Firestonebacteria bacterium]